MTIERSLGVICYCALCGHHTHDFPGDDWHEQRHMEGWHTCEVHEGFRPCRPFCVDFNLSPMVSISGGLA